MHVSGRWLIKLHFNLHHLIQCERHCLIGNDRGQDDRTARSSWAIAHLLARPFSKDLAVTFSALLYASVDARRNPMMRTITLSMMLTACGGGDASLCAGAESVLSEVNTARATHRQCGAKIYAAAQPLKLDDVLTQAAQRHAADLANTGTTSHTGSDGSTVTDRARAYGRPVGENLLTGDANLSHAMSRLLGSPGHCQNIMNPDAIKFGAACVETYRAVWVQVFGV